MDRRRVNVRRYADHLSALVAGFCYEVVPRDRRVDGVTVPDEDEFRLEPVVHTGDRVVLAKGDEQPRREVVDLALDVGVEAAELSDERPQGDAAHQAAVGCTVVDDGLRAVALDSVDDGVGDLAERPVPGDPLPLALAALARPLQGVEDAVFGVQHLAPHGALLAPHGVHVGHALLHRGVCAGLFLAPDQSVLDVDPEGAVAGVAGNTVAAPEHVVPTPLLAVDVLP